MARCGLDECDLYGGCLYDCPIDKPTRIERHRRIFCYFETSCYFIMGALGLATLWAA